MSQRQPRSQLDGTAKASQGLLLLPLPDADVAEVDVGEGELGPESQP